MDSLNRNNDKVLFHPSHTQFNVLKTNVVIGAENKMVKAAAWAMAGLPGGIILSFTVGKTVVPRSTRHFH